MGALEDGELCLFLARDLCTGTPQVTLREVAALSAELSQRRLTPGPVEPEELRAIEGECEDRCAQQRSGRKGDQSGRSYRAAYDPLESSTSE
jgi:hypothetical protein